MIKYYLKNNDFALTRGTEESAGYDIRADIGSPRVIEPGQRWRVPTGLYLSMPPGVFAMVCSRSGLAGNHAICVLNSPAIIDADYRGEVMVNLQNHDRQDHHPYTFNPGDRIAQVLFMPVLPGCAKLWSGMLPDRVEFWEPERVDSIEKLGPPTQRGAGGHGSTGR